MCEVPDGVGEGTENLSTPAAIVIIVLAVLLIVPLVLIYVDATTQRIVPTQHEHDWHRTCKRCGVQSLTGPDDKPVYVYPFDLMPFMTCRLVGHDWYVKCLDPSCGAANEMSPRPLARVTPIYTDERATKNPYRPYDWEVECPDLMT